MLFRSTNEILEKFGADLKFYKNTKWDRRKDNDNAQSQLLYELISLWENGGGKISFSNHFDPKTGKQQLSGPLARFLKAGLTPLYTSAKRRIPSDTQLIYLIRKIRRKKQLDRQKSTQAAWD